MLLLRDLETRIKRRLKRHLKSLGFVRELGGLLKLKDNGKDHIRLLHRNQREKKLKEEKKFIRTSSHNLLKYFASGSDVIPEKISPSLQLIQSNTLEGDLFRFASLLWTVPVSRGYGRRMRLLVWDQNNGKLIGLIALGDPVFNLKVRDEKIGWNQKQRRERLVNMMDAFVLGAIPPYNLLLGGKLIASLVRTTDIRDIFVDRYSDTQGIISGVKKNATLAMVTTSSALGRSSVYNRLKLGGVNYFESIGYTVGYGHFHIPDDLFDEMRQFLKRRRNLYAGNHQFGDGPNWRLRTIRMTLDLLGMNSELLRHGIAREVFISRLATNAEEYLRGDSAISRYNDLLSSKEVVELALDRWIFPRSRSRQDYMFWKAEEIINLIK